MKQLESVFWLAGDAIVLFLVWLFGTFVMMVGLIVIMGSTYSVIDFLLSLCASMLGRI